MDKTTDENEKSMEEQAFDHFGKGIDAEVHGRYDEAHGEYQTAIVLDGGEKKEYHDASKRTETQ